MATLAPIPLAPRRKWNTLEVLTRTRIVLFSLTAFLVAVTILGTQTHRDAMKLVGQDTAPSIIHAQKIKTALAAMDADAVDDLLNPGSSSSIGAFELHREAASAALVDAARNITYADGERQPIDQIEISMGTYARLIQEARDLEDDAQALKAAGKQDEASATQSMSVRYYRAAALVMDGTLLPAADALDSANDSVLTSEFSSRSNWSLASRVFTLLAGFALLAVLVGAQLYLSRRTQRTLNPALVAATLLTLGLTLYAFTAMAREQSDLDTAKQDAFASIHSLLQARATAYSANSDESRFLLDPLHAAEYNRAFTQKANALVRTSTHLSPAQLLAELRAGEHVDGFNGYLADELNNITFEGERDSAIQTVDAYENYLQSDATIRALDANGQHADAIATDVGASDVAFNQFDQALGSTLDINQKQFDKNVKAGVDVLAKLDWIAAIIGVLIAVLIFLGLAPRIREYV